MRMLTGSRICKETSTYLDRSFENLIVVDLGRLLMGIEVDKSGDGDGSGCPFLGDNEPSFYCG